MGALISCFIYLVMPLLVLTQFVVGLCRYISARKKLVLAETEPWDREFWGKECIRLRKAMIPLAIIHGTWLFVFFPFILCIFIEALS